MSFRNVFKRGFVNSQAVLQARVDRPVLTELSVYNLGPRRDAKRNALQISVINSTLPDKSVNICAKSFATETSRGAGWVKQ